MSQHKITFSFSPRWKEELVCSCSHGSFILEMPMGITTVYLPPEERWQKLAPAWAIPHWSTLHDQLTAWCRQQNIPLAIEATSAVYADAK